MIDYSLPSLGFYAYTTPEVFQEFSRQVSYIVSPEILDLLNKILGESKEQYIIPRHAEKKPYVPRHARKEQ